MKKVVKIPEGDQKYYMSIQQKLSVVGMQLTEMRIVLARKEEELLGQYRSLLGDREKRTMFLLESVGVGQNERVNINLDKMEIEVGEDDPN